MSFCIFLVVYCYNPLCGMCIPCVTCVSLVWHVYPLCGMCIPCVACVSLVWHVYPCKTAESSSAVSLSETEEVQDIVQMRDLASSSHMLQVSTSESFRNRILLLQVECLFTGTLDDAIIAVCMISTRDTCRALWHSFHCEINVIEHWFRDHLGSDSYGY